MSRVPAVTVVITALNAQTYIREAVKSVLKQTFTDFELIIADDGSTDSTLAILEEFAHQDDRIRIDSHPNMGMAESVNKLLPEISSDLMARMDADDVMLPERLEKQVKFMKAHPEVGLASCITRFIDESGKSMGVQHFDELEDLLTPDDTRRYVEENRCITFAHTGAIFRKRIVEEVGGYDKRFWPSDDIELFNKIADAGHGVVIIPEVLMLYRLHGSSVITSKFMDSVNKFYWVADSIHRRRSGQPEQTFEEFLQDIQAQPWLSRINRKRKLYASNYFRQAGYHLGRRDYPKFVANIGLSFLLKPTYTINKIRRKISN